MPPANFGDEVLRRGRRDGFRNAQTTVLAPTGTISFMMDCDTTGIEPDIALVKYKQLAGGGMLKIVNQTVPLALKTLGYDEGEVKSIVDFIAAEDTIEGAADIKDEHLPVFDCAFHAPRGTRSIHWKAHIRMMAAAQPFISGAISKTVNMPKDVKPEEVTEAYMEGWRLGLKALAIYRDGSKGGQPLITKKKSKKSAAADTVTAPRRERLPDTRQSITHKFSVAGHEGYITVGLYPDGRPGEMFITMAKEGSTIGGLMDCFGTAVSMSLQYGVPLEVYVTKFSHTRFEPMGHTKNKDIRIAKSLVDYIFRWLGITFLPGFREANGGEPPAAVEMEGKGGAAGANGELETDRRPAAGMDGGPKNGQDAAFRKETPRNGSALTSSNGNGRSNGSNGKTSHGGVKTKASISVLEQIGISTAVDLAPATFTQSNMFASFQADAPACDSCGAITVRSGNCYLCHNCGASMGCS